MHIEFHNKKKENLLGLSRVYPWNAIGLTSEN